MALPGKGQTLHLPVGSHGAVPIRSVRCGNLDADGSNTGVTRK